MLERPLVTVANRLPVRRTPEGWRPATGGLVTALQPVMEQVDGAWVGWDGGDSDVPERVEGFDVDLNPLSITRAQLQGYYHGFSNRTIWPLFHDLVEQPVFDRGWWETYAEVNHVFADRAMETPHHDGGALLWVHDYHLMLLPDLLRDRGASGPMSYFLHIPFPAPELFARLPWREALLDGLLGADVVSFHTEPYRRNFLGAVERLHPDREVSAGGIVHLPDGRAVHTAANPISIDAAAFAELATSDAAEEELARLREQFAGRKVLLGVDRLDYTKGIHQRFQAIEALLEQRPDLRGQIAFVQIAVPSRGGVREYRDLRRDVEREVGRINGRFTEPGGEVPVYYLHRGVARERLVAYYRLADVALVTPVKDGMNLIAKEYVVCQAAGGGAGALVLSEFTGAHIELRQAVACNPFDIEGLANRFGRALEMDEAERRARLEKMAATVHSNDIYRWVERELAAVGDAVASRAAAG